MFWIQQHLKGSFLTASAAKQAADVLEKKLKKSSTTNTGSGLSNTRFTLDSHKK